ncbi:MAG: ribonuclease D [Verrucomicrobiota bacterium]|nr:ribonuclease D [Verrucomicrobiota bacterium]
MTRQEYLQASAAVPATTKSAPVIGSADDLAQLIALLEKHARIAVDTEADSLHCYREKLCLIQISIPEGDYLVDPLAGVDLSPLTGTFLRREIILHGSDYDLRLMRRDMQFRPGEVFDTQIASRLLGAKEFSYAALVQKYFDVTLTKGSQKANWALRPLSEKMEAYARNDTHYLLPLAEKLERELRERGRMEWFRQSCQRAIELAAVARERDSDEVWRIKGSGLIRGRAAAVLRALWRWRDEEAERVDRPAFHVLRNDQLIAAAVSVAGGDMPQYRHVTDRRARKFQEAVRNAMALPEAEWPRFERQHRPRPSREKEQAADAVRIRRDQQAAALGIEASFIAARGTIDAIVVYDAPAEEFLVPWQREILGL